VDALRVDWGTPYALRATAQLWVGPSAIALAGHPPGHWQDFASGNVIGHPGRQTVRVAATPTRVRFLRLLLLASSHTAPAGSRDVRDRLGFAIRELGVGVLRGGRLHDLIHHVASNRQTITMASSTDPWHRASDRDPGTEQPGFDRVAASGLTNRLPLLTPVAVLYGTPPDAVAELTYLRAHHIPVRRVELGEEPDGQLATPEDYAALYEQFSRALHTRFAHLQLGGPGFQTSIPDWMAWPDAHGNRSWTSRFVGALRRAGKLAQLSFFSFEWYPFDNTCDPTGPQLAKASRTLGSLLARQTADGLPPSIPKLITKYGYSAFSGQAEVDRAGALLNADVVGRFFSDGGATAYLYGYEPAELIREQSSCNTWGNLALFQSDSQAHIRHALATYFGARLETRRWVKPGHGLHTLYPAAYQPLAGSSTTALSAYAVRRPDGRLALMLLNLDPTHTVTVHVAVTSRAGGQGLGGSLDLSSLSGAQYVWHPRDAAGYPAPDHPPAHTRVAGGQGLSLRLAPYSMSVLRTRGAR